MAYQRKNGDFILFKEVDKKNPNGPDYTGYGLDLDGRSIRLALWKKTNDEGKTFLTGNQQAELKPKQSPAKRRAEEDDDDFDM